MTRSRKRPKHNNKKDNASASTRENDDSSGSNSNIGDDVKLDNEVDDYADANYNNNIDINLIGNELLAMECEFIPQTTAGNTSKQHTFDNANTTIAKILLEVFKDNDVEGRHIIQAGISVVNENNKANLTELRQHLQSEMLYTLRQYQMVKADPEKFDAAELCTTYNNRTIVTKDEMAKYFDPSRINLSHIFEITTSLIVWKAYSPHGTKQIGCHCMPFNQCCIRLVLQTLPRYIEGLITGRESTKGVYDKMIKVIDRVILTAKKDDSPAVLDESYEADASVCGLDSRYEMFLFAVMTYIKHQCVAMAAKKNSQYKVPTIIASSSTDKELNDKEGMERYLDKGKSDNIIRMGHSQMMMMRVFLSRRYEKIRKEMSINIVQTYSHVLELTAEQRIAVDSGSVGEDLLANFGFGDGCTNDIDLGVLTTLARMMAPSGEITADNITDLRVDRLSPAAAAVYKHDTTTTATSTSCNDTYDE